MSAALKPLPAVPPVLSPAAAPPVTPRRWPLCLFATSVLGLLLLRLATDWQVPLPKCWLREVVGVPCVSCGVTRAAVAVTHGDWRTALRLNPLATISVAGSAIGGVLWCVDAVLGTRTLARLARMARRRPWGWLALGLLAVNWLYLIVTAGSGG